MPFTTSRRLPAPVYAYGSTWQHSRNHSNAICSLRFQALNYTHTQTYRALKPHPCFPDFLPYLIELGLRNAIHLERIGSLFDVTFQSFLRFFIFLTLLFLNA